METSPRPPLSIRSFKRLSSSLLQNQGKGSILSEAVSAKTSLVEGQNPARFEFFRQHGKCCICEIHRSVRIPVHEIRGGAQLQGFKTIANFDPRLCEKFEEPSDPFPHVLEKKRRLGYNRPRGYKRFPQKIESRGNPFVTRILSIEECHERPRVQKGGPHFLQFRSRTKAFSGCDSPIVSDESTQPVRCPARSPKGRRSRLRRKSSRMYSDSLFWSALADRLRASRCSFGSRMVKVEVLTMPRIHGVLQLARQESGLSRKDRVYTKRFCNSALIPAECFPCFLPPCICSTALITGAAPRPIASLIAATTEH